MTRQRFRPARHVLRAHCFAIIFFALTQGPVQAQSDAQIREEIRFARGVKCDAAGDAIAADSPCMRSCSIWFDR